MSIVHLIIEPFRYEFMQHALLSAVLLSVSVPVPPKVPFVATVTALPAASEPFT